MNDLIIFLPCPESFKWLCFLSKYVDLGNGGAMPSENKHCLQCDTIIITGEELENSVASSS